MIERPIAEEWNLEILKVEVSSRILKTLKLDQHDLLVKS